jgi:hypothetical protein
MQCPSVAFHPVSEGSVTVSNSLTKAEFRCRPPPGASGGEKAQATHPTPYIRLCSGLQTGYQRAIKALSCYRKSLISKASDIP